MDENAFRTMFETQARSSALRDVWRDAYGDDFPEDADPASFVTRADLRGILEALDLGSGDDLVDVGCGPGGPGAAVARANGARLTGIDPVAAALELARDRQLATLPAGSAFRRGDFTATGLADSYADGLMSTDALLFAPDPAAAFAEFARILEKGRRMAFTTFELRSHSKALAAGPIPDYRPFLSSAGFVVESYEETPDWERRMRAVFSGILSRRERIEREVGDATASLLCAWATLRPSELSESRRIAVVALRP